MRMNFWISFSLQEVRLKQDNWSSRAHGAVERPWLWYGSLEKLKAVGNMNLTQHESGAQDTVSFGDYANT